MLQPLHGWALEANPSCIRKAWEFDTFKTAMRFVMAVAELADAHDHHPEFLWNYALVTIRLTTHDVGGLTDKDDALAKAIDELVSRDFAQALKPHPNAELG